MYDMGQRLRSLREDMGLSRNKLAEKLGVSKSTVQRHELNTQMPTADHISTLALLYRVSSEYLLGLEHRANFAVENLTDKQIEILSDLINEFTEYNDTK